MSLVRRLQSVRNQVPASTQTFDNKTHVGPKVNLAGVSIDRDRALKLSTFWACVTARAEDLSALPFDVIERQGKKRIEKPLPTWLEKPNPETTGNELIEMTSASIDTDGNAFWWYERDRIGRVAEVWAMEPSKVKVFRRPNKRGEPINPKEFSVDGKPYGLDQIVHIPGFRIAGSMRGLNPIDYHRHTLGLAAAAEEYGETFFGRGATMTGVITLDSDPGEENAARMQDSFVNDHGGLRNAHRPGVLFGGAKWEQLTIPNETAQFLETRSFQRSEICGWMRVPPHKIGDLEHATFSNIEHQAIEWVVDGLTPMGGRIERAIKHAGLLSDPGDRMRIRYNGRLRGDTAARFAAYAIGRQWGWLCVNDIRELEDLDPVDGGDVYLEPLNMKAIGEAQQGPAVLAALRAAGLSPELIAAATGQPIPQEATA